MSVSLPNGALVALASAYGAVIPFSALSNAAPAVGTFTSGHGILADDFLEVTSGWTRLTQKIIKAGVSAATTVEFAGQDTTAVGTYPVGGGAGSVREITGWTQLAQIVGSATSGGVQQFLTYQFLEGDNQLRIPTYKDPFGVSFQIADDPTLAGYQLVVAANDDRQPRAVRVTLPGGSVLLYNCYISVNKTPTLSVNALMEVTVTLALLAEPVRY